VLKCAWNNLGPAGLLFGKAVAKHNSLQEVRVLNNVFQSFQLIGLILNKKLDVSRTNLGKTIEFMIRGAGACISMKYFFKMFLFYSLILKTIFFLSPNERRVHLSQNTIDIKAQRHLVRMINDGACQL